MKVAFYNDYAGTPTSHSLEPVGTDSATCVVVTWPRGDCSETIIYNGSLLSYFSPNLLFSKDTNPDTDKVKFATGVFAGVKRVMTTDVKGYPEDQEFTIFGVQRTP
jgi:hypothetical protein